MKEFKCNFQPLYKQEIILEYDLKIPKVGESSEKSGYLEDLGAIPGDIWGIWNKYLAKFELEMLYDEYLTFVTISNLGSYGFLISGQKLVKICHTAINTTPQT